MSNIHHHPEDSSLTAYAAGSLPAALALVVGCHLEFCSRCRNVVSSAETLGGELLNELPVTPLKAGAHESILARLDGLVPEPAPSPQLPKAAAEYRGNQLPSKLSRLLGDKDLEAQGWRTIGPGIELLKLDCGEGNAVLLNIAPGKSVPVHTHKGTELTLILQGAYNDKLGRFAAGDVADLDPSIEHQPCAEAEGCLCLAGLDAPLSFSAWIPRLLQPMIGL